MELERKTFPLTELKADASGTFEGYASVFGNVDQGGDVVEKGAFKEFETTTDGQIRLLYQHDESMPVGKASFTQDEKGLKVKGTLQLGVSYVRDIYELMKSGVLDQMSIGYSILQKGSDITDEGIRRLTALKLWESSIVTFAMNRSATVDSVKRFRAPSGIGTPREFEKWLKLHGFSQDLAKSITNNGFRRDVETSRRDAGSSVSERLAIMKTQTLILNSRY